MSSKIFESSSGTDNTTQALPLESPRFDDFGDDFNLDDFSEEETPAAEQASPETPVANSDKSLGEETLSSNEQNEIAGNYSAEDDSLISKEYQIKQDQETPSPRSQEQKGSVRAVTVMGGLGGMIAAGAILWFGFLNPKAPPQKVATPEPTTTPTTPVPDETARLKSQLAFTEQQQQVEKANQNGKTQNSQQPPAKGVQPNKPIKAGSPTPAKAGSPPARPVQPAPRPIQPAPRPVAVRPASPAPARQAAPAKSTQERPVDPFKRWQELSELGQEGKANGGDSPVAQTSATANNVLSRTDAALGVPGASPAVATTNASIPTPTPQTQNPGLQSATIESATIGTPATTDSEIPTPGETGILNSQQVIASAPVLTEPQSSPIPKNALAGSQTVSDADLAMFTAADQPTATNANDIQNLPEETNNPVPPAPTNIEAANGTATQIVTISPPETLGPQTSPMVNAIANTPVSQTQEVTLGTTVQGKVTVPLIWGADGRTQTSERGAIELTEPLLSGDGKVALPVGTILITQTTSTDGIPRTDVIAVVRKQNGKVQQYPLPPNILVVRGDNGKPLEGRNINQVNPSLLKGDDLLVGIIGAVGQVGEILNRPDTQTSSAFGTGGFSQSTVTQSQDPNIVGAILQGALQPASQRIERRLQDRERAQQQRNRPNVNVVERGATVTIVAQNLLRVNP